MPLARVTVFADARWHVASSATTAASAIRHWWLRFAFATSGTTRRPTSSHSPLAQVGQ